jgi:hypothetical protein
MARMPLILEILSRGPSGSRVDIIPKLSSIAWSAGRFLSISGADLRLLARESAALQRRIAVELVAFLSAYCLAQFLIVLITISQVGRLYITACKNESSGRKVSDPAPGEVS